jgi:hypothetical protein
MAASTFSPKKGLLGHAKYQYCIISDLVSVWHDKKHVCKLGCLKIFHHPLKPNPSILNVLRKIEYEFSFKHLHTYLRDGFNFVLLEKYD